ncbi:hypothetical protein PMAYCL1PPCAC_26201, partial [Pristionchus mayeri]
MNFKLRISLLLFLQLVLNEAPPVKEGPSAPKKAKSCYFDNGGPSGVRRADNSHVSSNCDGVRIDMSTLANKPGSHGAPSELAFVLARGDGVFLEKDEDSSKWSGKLICNNHLRELSRQYELPDFKHFTHSKRGDVRCGFPRPNHHRNALPPWGWLTYDQSKAILESDGYLLHPGTPLCHDDYDSLRSMSVDDGGEAETVGEGQCATDLTDPPFVHQERKPRVSVHPTRKMFYDLARVAGVRRVECRKKYSELGVRGKRYRLH